ncbi:MAG TPA: hypothetical protein VFB37_01150 [Steroidobacteraceae bacterium]|nr:hypothetical protein [Steroidobacteraceae bacterium]
MSGPNAMSRLWCSLYDASSFIASKVQDLHPLIGEPMVEAQTAEELRQIQALVEATLTLLCRVTTRHDLRRKPRERRPQRKRRKPRPPLVLRPSEPVSAVRRIEHLLQRLTALPGSGDAP